jgi:hypothetical protein
VSAAGDEARGDGIEQLGTFEIVRAGKALAGKSVAAGTTQIARNLMSWVTGPAVGAGAAVPEPRWIEVGGAVRPGAMWGSKTVRADALDWPAQHAVESGKPDAGKELTEFQ